MAGQFRGGQNDREREDDGCDGIGMNCGLATPLV
jgi:hypothetical protein